MHKYRWNPTEELASIHMLYIFFPFLWLHIFAMKTNLFQVLIEYWIFCYLRCVRRLTQMLWKSGRRYSHKLLFTPIFCIEFIGCVFFTSFRIFITLLMLHCLCRPFNCFTVNYVEELNHRRCCHLLVLKPNGNFHFFLFMVSFYFCFFSFQFQKVKLNTILMLNTLNSKRIYDRINYDMATRCRCIEYALRMLCLWMKSNTSFQFNIIFNRIQYSNVDTLSVNTLVLFVVVVTFFFFLFFAERFFQLFSVSHHFITDDRILWAQTFTVFFFCFSPFFIEIGHLK